MWTLKSVKMICSFKINSNYLDVKAEIFKKDVNRPIRSNRNFTIGESDFNKLMEPRSQLVVGSEKFAREQNLLPIQTTAMF